VTYLYTCLLYPLVVFNLIMTLLTLYISTIRTTIKGSISDYANAAAMLVGCFVSGGVFLGEMMGLGSKGRFGRVGGVKEMKVWYIPVFLLRTVLYSLILQLGTIFSFDGYILYAAGVLIASYFLIILFVRPY
jgi:hypothetical protein